MSISRRRAYLAVPMMSGVLIFCCASVALAQDGDWHPSQWGADDQRGAANRLSPAEVLAARNLITTGRVYQLGRVLEAGIPVFGTRHYSLKIPHPLGPLGANQTMGHEAIISGELGQLGTQFDGLGHIGVGDLFYNGLSRHDFARPDGLTMLGVENVGPIVTRGVLIDVAAYKGMEMLEGGYEITRSDLVGALDRQSVSITPGDVVLIHTGWGSLWMVDNDRFNASEPGIGLEAAEFLIEAEIMMVGADTWATEVLPNPDPTLAFPVSIPAREVGRLQHRERGDRVTRGRSSVRIRIRVRATSSQRGGRVSCKSRCDSIAACTHVVESRHHSRPLSDRSPPRRRGHGHLSCAVKPIL